MWQPKWPHLVHFTTSCILHFLLNIPALQLLSLRKSGCRPSSPRNNFFRCPCDAWQRDGNLCVCVCVGKFKWNLNLFSFHSVLPLSLALSQLNLFSFMITSTPFPYIYKFVFVRVWVLFSEVCVCVFSSTRANSFSLFECFNYDLQKATTKTSHFLLSFHLFFVFYFINNILRVHEFLHCHFGVLLFHLLFCKNVRSCS